MKADYVAAWVPDDDPQRSWDEAALLAVHWVRKQADRLSLEPLLVTYSFQVGEGFDAFAGLEHVTLRSPGRVTGPIGRPVLAYVPYEGVMALAHRHARKSALCAVESSEFPLSGWAREVAAENLLTGAVLPSLTEPSASLLDRLMFYGNNAWGDQFGRRRATDLLSDLRPLVDRAEVLGHVLAHGSSDRGIANLVKIMDKLHWPKRSE